MATPDMIPSEATGGTPPRVTQQEQEAMEPPPTPNSSHVNGVGLWSSWQRSFKLPELALLDLFDNCIDATLHDDFEGHIKISRDFTGGIAMTNNCRRKVPSMEKVLEVFGSSKGGDEIGENGVGVKQACAALSDLSIVVSKNKRLVSIGLINKGLQTAEGVCLPSFELRRDAFQDDLDKAFATSPEFQLSLEQYGDGDMNLGRHRLEGHMDSLLNSQEDHSFLLILHRVLQRSTGGGVPGLLEKIRLMLPRHYLHVPPNFEVVVDDQLVQFQFWEKGLAELHTFSLCIDPKHSFELATDWHSPNNGYIVDIYLGFDPIRACVPNKNKAALLIYSRKSGRLVREVQDARGMLGLNTGGTDFGQGLTIIIDDHEGFLPLTPTKQDIAFGNEASGLVHEANLTSWIGACADMFYKFFLDRFGRKASLGDEVRRYEAVVKTANANKMPIAIENTLRNGTFSTVSDVSFSRDKPKGKIRCSNRKSNQWAAGEATLIKFRKVAVTPKKTAKRAIPNDSPSTAPARKKAKKAKPAAAAAAACVTDTKVPAKKMLEIIDDDSSTSSYEVKDYRKMTRMLKADLDNQTKLKEIFKAEVATLKKENTKLKSKLAKVSSKSGDATGDDAELQLRCQTQESEIEKMKSKIAAYKVHMTNLRRTNESLQQLADL